MANKHTSYIINGATALYPHLNRTYRFDKSKTDKYPFGETVPCEIQDDGAEYTLSLELSEQEAIKLYNLMQADYVAKKAPTWKEFLLPHEVFEYREDTGTYVAKTKLPAMFDKDITTPVKQFDAKNKKLKATFELTTGSEVNALVQIVVYMPQTITQSGVSLRLRQVQIKTLAEKVERSMFNVIDGGFSAPSEGFAQEDPEEVAVAVAVAVETKAGGFNVATPAPAKPAPAKPVAVEAPATNIVANDIDMALDELTFDVPKKAG